MSTMTTNLSLIKPQMSDHITDTIPNLASNFDTIDNQFGILLKNAISVLSYSGVDPTGTTDSTTGIQNAINDAITKNSIVFFPRGTYLVGALTIPYGTPLELVGQGWSYDAGAGTTLKSNSASAMFTPANGANGTCIRDMVLDGNNTGTYAWYGQYGNKSRFENLFIQNFTNTGVFSREGLLVVKDSYIKNCTSYGLDINSDSWITDNEISVCGVGIRVVAGGCRITDNLINSNTSYGVLLDGTIITSNTVGWNLVSGGYIGENTTANIMLKGDPTNRNCRYNQIADTFIQQVSNVAAAGISFQNTDVNTISDVLFLGGIGGNISDTGGISLNSAHNTQINNVTAYDSTNTPLAIVGSNDVAINGFSSYNHGNSSTNAYGITIDSGSNRTRLNSIAITDTRSPGYSKGINNSGGTTTIVDYRLYTPAASPDSLGSANSITYNINNGKFQIDGVSNVGIATAVTSGATTATINLNEWYADTNYSAIVTPNWNTTVWVTGKQVGQFTANFGTAAPANATVDWKTHR